MAYSLNPAKWSKSFRIIFMLTLSFIVFLLEIIVGYASSSIALIADSFHMLSDVIALIVAFYAIKLANKNPSSNFLTYGWQRAEVLGALINAVFLLALCFTILLEAIERFIFPKEIENPKIVLVVGGIGLFFNLVGILLFHDAHGHSHGHSDHHHSHSHDNNADDIVADKHETDTDFSKGTTVVDIKDLRYESTSSVGRFFGAFPANQVVSELVEEQAKVLELHHHSGQDHDHYNHTHEHNHSHQQNDKSHNHSHSHEGHMNMHGIFVHVLGDFLGSIGVIVAALVIWLSTWEYRHYVDPLLSVVMTVIMLITTIPLLRSSSHILLQGMPQRVSLDRIRKEITMIEGVLSVHELHIWQLSEVKNVASVHVTCKDQAEYMKIAVQIKRLFHKNDIHSITVQPEFSNSTLPELPYDGRSSGNHEIDIDSNNEETCLLACQDRECENNSCCPLRK